MNTSKLFEMYNSTFKPALAEGKYTVTLKSHEYVAHEKTPYIRIEMTIKDTDRVVVENRFENTFPVMISHLRQQLKREQEEVIPTDFLDELIENKTEFNIWVVKRIINGAQKTNVNFLEPIKQDTAQAGFVTETKPNLTVVDDDPTAEPEKATEEKVEESTEKEVEEPTEEDIVESDTTNVEELL